MKSWRLNQFCCGCSLQTGTKLVGFLSLGIGIVVFFLALIGSLANVRKIGENVYSAAPTQASNVSVVLVNDNEPLAGSILRIIWSSFTIATSILILISAWKDHKPTYLMPWLASQAVSFLVAIGYSLYFGVVFLFIAGGSALVIGYLIGCFVGAAIWISSWLVVYSYYRELKEKVELPKQSEMYMSDYESISINDEPYYYRPNTRNILYRV